MAKTEEVQEQKAQSESLIKKIFNNITIEPMFICYFIPFYFGGVFIENMNLEKSCRSNINMFTNITNDICELFVRKQEYGIECDNTTMTNITEDTLNIIQMKHSNIFELVINNLTSVVDAICDVEDVVQLHLTDINTIRTPISSFGPLIIILFAAGWSDKKGRRVPCMLLPYLGEAFGFFSLFVSALYINDIPVEVPAYLYRLIPSITGADSLMTIAAFSYLGAISTDENRFFRFGLFQVIIAIVPFAGTSLSPTLFNNFGYAEYFGWCLPVHFIGFLYIIYFIKEVKTSVGVKEGIDNTACDVGSTDQIENQSALEEKKNFCVEFFNPELPISCIKVVLKKRVSPIRVVVILIILSHFLLLGVPIGESVNFSLLLRKIFNTDQSLFSYLNSYITFLGITGMLIMLGLNKLFKIRDIVVILLTSIISIISKLIIAQSTKVVDVFIAIGVDFLGGTKHIASKSLISKLVPASDLSSMYAMMGIFEQIAVLVFPTVFATIYKSLLGDNINVGYIYYLSSSILLLPFVFYLIIFKLLRSHTTEEIEDNEEKNTDANKVAANAIELTKL